MTEMLRIAVHKFASCDGCQLQFLNLEQDLLTLANRVKIVHFAEASSDMGAGPYDLSFVEGSISTSADLKRIQEVRAASRLLVTIGACATAGGLQALRNWKSLDAFVKGVYASPEYIDSLAQSTPISAHVNVDAELWGCPIDQTQLKRVLCDVLAGVNPRIPGESVCMECKRAGNVCVLVAKREPCLGPVTRTGCGALCPRYERDCYGCFGPQEDGNTAALGRRFLELGLSNEDIVRRLRFINGWAPAFRAGSQAWER
jgi:coenzyme F420-reducing hydrogenase gamma subunit